MGCLRSLMGQGRRLDMSEMDADGAHLARTGWDCQEFRAGLGMMGAKEPAHAATQRTPYS
jgi:hypothetical protein